ncbi:hypothetical protein K4F52_010270 [Lecanicillium sp. MT-2017a]|nr:hypothetical protein K4F52_010270 [Lecanicillium sp. MT-2017a]
MNRRKKDSAGHRASQTRTIKANKGTFAARWNIKLFRALQDALIKDPESDISALLPTNYSEKLKAHKTGNENSNPELVPETQPCDAGRSTCDDVRSRLHATDSYDEIVKPSPELSDLLSRHGNGSHAIIGLLAKAEVVYKSAWAASVCVFRVSDSIAVKVTGVKFAKTEIGSLLYLQKHLPSLPTPRPHGMVRLGAFTLLFTAFIPGLDLERAWPQLDDDQKRDVSVQLDKYLQTLRALPFPPHLDLGGVQKEGCKDARRGVRVNAEPIVNAKQFEDFIFAGSNTASPLYTGLLRGFLPKGEPKCVFTHGDIRPANIMVQEKGDGGWTIAAVIDWETSGFYPEYWESIKMTNTLTATETFDWYNYLPESVSPKNYAIQWLVDRVWDRSLVNS